MRKYMNVNLYRSKIFKHARFAADPGTTDLDGGIQTENESHGGGGGSSSEDGNNDNGNNDGEDIDSLKRELAQLKADNTRYKNSINKLTEEKGKLTKQNREMMSAEEIAKQAQEERDKLFAEMEKELRTNKYSKRSVGIGMSEAEADEFAATLPKLEDEDAFFTAIGKFVKAREKAAADKAIQELLKSRPDINAGNGDADKDSPAMALAKASVAKKNSLASKVNNDTLKNFM